MMINTDDSFSFHFIFSASHLLISDLHCECILNRSFILNTLKHILMDNICNFFELKLPKAICSVPLLQAMDISIILDSTTFPLNPGKFYKCQISHNSHLVTY